MNLLQVVLKAISGFFLFRLLAKFFTFLFSPLVRLYHFFVDEPQEQPSMLDSIVLGVENWRETLSHLDEFRVHLIRSFVVLLFWVVASFFFLEQLSGFLILPLDAMGEKLQSIGVTEQLNVLMQMALFFALGLTTPYLTFEIWLFMAPGLRPVARFWSLVCIPLALLLFIGGAAFAYYVMLPVGLPVLLNLLPGVESNPSATEYFNFVVNLLLAVGVLFEFPLVTFALGLMGILRPRTLLKYWRLSLFGIAILAAMLTPTTDWLNMLVLMLPMVFLYFLSILSSWLAQFLRQPAPAKK